MIQIETAMGAAIEVFEGSRDRRGRERFLRSRPPATSCLRSDVYEVGPDTC